MNFTINFKGRKDPRDPKMVNLDMGFCQQGGFNRVARVVNITGPYKSWDEPSQSFKGTGRETVQRNQLLLDLKNQYHFVAEQWQKEGRIFSTLQWADCFKEKEVKEVKQKKIKSLSVEEMLGIRVSAGAPAASNAQKTGTERLKTLHPGIFRGYSAPTNAGSPVHSVRTQHTAHRPNAAA